MINAERLKLHSNQEEAAGVSDRTIHLEHRVATAEIGMRVDQAAAVVWSDYSRSRLTDWIREGALRVDASRVKPNYRLREGQQLELRARLQDRPDAPDAEAMALDVLYQDDEVIVVDKPAGRVVHPGSGNTEGTLVNGLLHHDPSLATLPRAGLIHRLDKDTSGCLVVARTPLAHRVLVDALKHRRVGRRYLAVIWGEMIAGGSVDAPLGRHPVDRRRQIVRNDGRSARTHYRIHQRLTSATLLSVRLETGRTHQIRVHMQHIGYPLIGDPTYGRRGSPAGLTSRQREVWRRFPRQALHAWQLEFEHPVSGAMVRAEAPIPEDLSRLIDALKPDPGAPVDE
jgi:23S rRNA pseudouridine1911/1915/1917 synthase